MGPARRPEKLVPNRYKKGTLIEFMADLGFEVLAMKLGQPAPMQSRPQVMGRVKPVVEK